MAMSKGDKDRDEKKHTKKGTQAKKKNGNGTRRINSGLEDGWVVDSYSGLVSGMSQNQDWALCDKDCGWCGHCGDGIL